MRIATNTGITSNALPCLCSMAKGQEMSQRHAAKVLQVPRSTLQVRQVLDGPAYSQYIPGCFIWVSVKLREGPKTERRETGALKQEV
jgi:hypothetical protein